MIPVNPAYDIENAKKHRTPVYRATFAEYTSPVTYRRFSTHKIVDSKTEALADSPSGFWRFNESVTSPVTTAAADSSGNALNGVYQNAPTLAAVGPLVGSSQTGVTLNGVDEYISVADNALLDPGDIFTLQVWVKRAIGSAGTLFDKGANGYLLKIDSLDRVVVQKNGVATITESAVSSVGAGWTKITLTKNGATVKIYINGVDATGSVANQTIAATASDLNIGRTVAGAAYFTGSLYGAAIYPTALSAARVLAQYNADLLGQYNTLWLPYMELPQGIAAEIEPENGRSSIGAVTAVFGDDDGEITEMVDGIGADTVTFEMGFTDIQGEEFEAFLTGKVEGCKLTSDMAGYEITVRDPQSLTNRDVFEVAASPLTVALTDVATTAVVRDATVFMDSGYVRIDDELVQYTGKIATGIPPAEKIYVRIAYGNGYFIAVGTAGAIARTTDGVNWSMMTPPTAQAAAIYTAIAFAPELGTAGRWVAIATGISAGAYSDNDGLTWTAMSMPPSGADYRSIAWSGTLFAVGSTTSAFASSVDGINWTARTGSDRGGTSMIWVPWLATPWFVSCATFGAGYSDRIATSPDAITWTKRTITDDQWNGLAHDGATVIVAVSGTGNVRTSNDAVTWTDRTEAASNAWQDLVYAGGMAVPKFIAVASTGASRVQYSIDGGVTWASASAAVANEWRGIAAQGALAISVSQNGTGDRAMSSSDGITWANYTSKLTGLTRGVDVASVTTVAAAHAVGAAVQEVIRLGPAHPMDILLDVYQNTDKTGLSIAASFIDSTAIAAVKTSLGAAYQMEFLITAKVNAKQWIESEICAPLGLYPVTSGTGLMSVIRFAVPSGPVQTIDNDSIVTEGQDPQVIMTWDRNLDSIINSVVFVYGYNGLTGEFQESSEYIDQTSINAYGRLPLTLQSKGLHSSLAGTDDLIEAVATTILDRYKDGAPLVTMRTFLQTALIEAGDIVAVTSALLPDKASGLRGVTGELMEVTGRSIMFNEGYVDLTLVDTGWNQ